MDVPDYAITSKTAKKNEHVYTAIPPQDEQKSSSTKRWRIPARGVCTIIGGFLVCLSFGSDFSYPNINTYLTSYMRQNGYNDNLAYTDFVYLITTKMVIQGAAMPFLGDLARRMGPKISVALGSLIYSGGYLLTYFTVMDHFVWAVISLSLHGIAFCFVYATTICTAQAWFPPSRKGLVASIVVSGYGFGSSLWAPIQTNFVNPENIKAGIKCNPHKLSNNSIEGVRNCTDVRQGPHKYYTDPMVLDRVPFMFLLLGAIYAVMGVIAVVLISEPKNGNKQLTEKEELAEEEETISESKPQNITKNLSPLEVLKTGWFYQIWVGFFSISLTIAIMGTYSKTFGLTFINDDHFYSTVAIFQNILNGFSRIVWGFSYDRFGFKKCFLVICSTVCITIATLTQLPNLGDGVAGRLCYACWMCLLYATCPGIYAIIAAEVSQAFGPLHYQANFGLLYTQYVAYSVVIIIISQHLFSILGYKGMFFIAAVFGVIGLLVVLAKEIFKLFKNLCSCRETSTDV